jgi:hypothetical protein
MAVQRLATGESPLKRPGFFAGDGSQDSYTLKPIERKGLSFVMDRSFDQGISRADIIEAEARKLPGEGAIEGSPSPWSVVMRDRHNALQRLGHVAPRVSFGSGDMSLATSSLPCPSKRVGSDLQSGG